MRRGSHGLANVDWLVEDPGRPGHGRSDVAVTLAVLMDIREELRAISARLDCHDTLAIPGMLRQIRIATNRIPARKRGKK